MLTLKFIVFVKLSGSTDSRGAAMKSAPLESILLRGSSLGNTATKLI